MWKNDTIYNYYNKVIFTMIWKSNFKWALIFKWVSSKFYFFYNALSFCITKSCLFSSHDNLVSFHLMIVLSLFILWQSCFLSSLNSLSLFIHLYIQLLSCPSFLSLYHYRGMSHNPSLFCKHFIEENVSISLFFNWCEWYIVKIL